MGDFRAEVSRRHWLLEIVPSRDNQSESFMHEHMPLPTPPDRPVVDRPAVC